MADESAPDAPPWLESWSRFQWSSEELATIQVLAVPDSQGRQQALTRSFHAKGRIFVSSSRFQYQATGRDGSTQVEGMQDRQQPE